MANEKDKKDIRGRQKKTPVWEWIVAALGLVFVTAALGMSLYRVAFEESKPSIIEISVESIVQAGSGYLVEFRVVNTGNQTAAALTVEGELKRGEESVEISTATLAYAPANSERRGGLLFTRNPNDFELKIRAMGYEKP